MYKIIGGDGKEYGPVPAEQIKQWIAEGRANAQTRVCEEGSTEWKPLASFPELAMALPLLPPPGAPVAASVVPPAERVRGPAIFLLVLAVLDLVSNLAFIPLLPMLPKLEEAFPVLMKGLGPESRLFIQITVWSCALGAALALLRLIGALKMLKMRSYGFAMATAILTLLPWWNCCCLLNLAAGIWALVVLTMSEVKGAFQ
ncbi:MAG: DUF4339 domain-containing protein [Verrucomicrobiales bacterium]|nr:DUF4339 domain-containing protein [Verrucomicrobiales bacterium]